MAGRPAKKTRSTEMEGNPSSTKCRVCDFTLVLDEDGKCAECGAGEDEA